jgi:sulfonate transport system substrate-binding protein
MNLKMAVSIFSACLVATSCGNSSSVSTPESITAVNDFSGVTLRVGESGASMFGVYRDRSGQFDGPGYQIEIVNFGSSSELLEALQAGAVDVAHLTDATSVVLAQGNAETPWTVETSPLAIVAAWSNPEHPGFSLLVNNPAITSVSDLEGKKVAYSKGSMGHYFFNVIVDEAGLKNVEGVQLPPPEGRAAFASGAVDALITVYRSALALLEEGDRRIIDSSSRVMDFYQVSVVRTELLEDAVKVRAVDDLFRRSDLAAEWASRNLDAVSEHIVAQGLLDKEDADVVAQYEIRRRVEIEGKFSSWIERLSEVFLESGVIASKADTRALLVDFARMLNTTAP